MLISLLEFIERASDAEAAALSLEDFAIANAYLDSVGRDSEKAQAYPSVHAKTQIWLREFAPPAVVTEGRRGQPFLRQYIDQLQLHSASRLHPNELDILITALALMRQSAVSSHFSRIYGLIAPHESAIHARRETVKTGPGLLGLQSSLHVLCARDITSVSMRSITNFAGIDLPGRGPVFVVSGQTKVLDTVPESAMLVVEDGSCTVCGYVIGRVAASGACEVRENVGGVVIARDGDIRCRNAVNTAYLISKRGSVYCRAAETPSLIFGGESITVRESARIAKCISPRISVGGGVLGGVYLVSHEMAAHEIRSAATQPARIALPWRITPADYGEVLDGDAEKLIRRLARNRLEAQNVRNMAAIAESESEHYASSALMFLFGGDTLRARIEEINAAQRRLAFLDRVITGIDAISPTVDDQINAGHQSKPSAEDWTDPIGGALDEVAAEIRQIEDDGALDEDLRARQAEYFKITQEAEHARRQGPISSAMLGRLREKRTAWLIERDHIFETIKQRRSSLESILGKIEILDSNTGDTSKYRLLAGVLTHAKQRPEGDVLKIRAGSSFVGLMIRSIRSRRERLDKYEQLLAKFDTEIAHILQQLRQRFNIDMHDSGEIPAHTPRVAARFEAGVVIAADPGDLESATPGPALVVTGGSLAGAFIRTTDGIAREAP